MNILVIGNGFDLAHGLPTKYQDFLNFCNVIDSIYNPLKNIERLKVDLIFYKINEEIGKKLKEVFESRIEDINTDKRKYIKIEDDILNEFYKLISDNIWRKYFSGFNRSKRENWTGFESEISGLIRSLDDDLHFLNDKYDLIDIVVKLTDDFLKNRYPYKDKKITYKKIRDDLLDDLNKLVRAFEIYLTKYVESINIKKKSPDIREIIETINQNKEEICILSFNYTHIIKKIYLDRCKDELISDMDYIHGEADIKNTIETNNMVLGIDEYLGKKRRNKDVKFIAFKKYYQRIHKQTGCKYKEWVDEIKDGYAEYQNRINNTNVQLIESFKDGSILQYPFQKEHFVDRLQEECPTHNLYIFGHSLDVTDKDILRDLILNDNVHTTIFYHDKDTMGQQIANLVKVIGQDELIRRTGGSTKTIEFVPQKPMEKIKDS